MMTRIVFAAILLLPALLGAQEPSASRAPEPSVTGAAIEQVVTLLRTGERLPRGTIGLEQRVLEPRPAPASGPEARTYVLGSAVHDSTLYRALGARRLDFESAVVCATDSPRSCRLPGVVAMFAAGAPRAVGGSAYEVVIAVRWRSDLLKEPVPFARFAVTVECSSSGGWRARDVRTLFIS